MTHFGPRGPPFCCKNGKRQNRVSTAPACTDRICDPPKLSPKPSPRPLFSPPPPSATPASILGRLLAQSGVPWWPLWLSWVPFRRPPPGQNSPCPPFRILLTTLGPCVPPWLPHIANYRQTSTRMPPNLQHVLPTPVLLSTFLIFWTHWGHPNFQPLLPMHIILSAFLIFLEFIQGVGGMSEATKLCWDQC